MKIIAAALLYFAIVFTVGLTFGPIRVLWLEPKIGGVLADENGQGVFKFGAAPGERGGVRFRGGEFRFGASNVEFVADAPFEAAAHELHLLFAQVDGRCDRSDFGVERAQGKIILRYIRVQEEQDIVERGDRRLCLGAGALEAATDAAP